MQTVREILGWLNLPFDAQTLWSFLQRSVIPLLPTLVVVVVAFFRDAPFLQVALLTIFAFVIVYIVVVVSSEILRQRRKSSPGKDETRDEQGHEELETIKQERDDLRAEVAGLRTKPEPLEKIEGLKQYENRWLLRLALKDAYEEGLHLKKLNPSDRYKDVGLWEHRIYLMMEDALPYEASKLNRLMYRSIKPSPENRFGFDVDEEQGLDIALEWLESFIEELGSRNCPNLHSDFNAREWVTER